MPKDLRATILHILFVFGFLTFGFTIKNLFLSKYFINHYPPDSFIMPCFVQNKGAAFGFLNNSAVFLGIVGLIFVFAIFFYVYKRISFSDKFLLFSLSVFSSGVLGNSIERFLQGYVTDYFRFAYFDFPAFNSFDVMINAALWLYVISVLVFEWKKIIKKV